MKAATLKSRAIVFALCAGGVAFFLSLLVTTNGSLHGSDLARALIPAIVCATMCWASTQRIVANTAEAIDLAIDRLAEAAGGDLAGPIPTPVSKTVPRLSEAMASLFGQLSANLNRVERLAMVDPVTGLPNRSSFRAACESLIAASTHDSRAALLFIDLDRFKAVNDTNGHAAGDMLLTQVADRLRTIAGESRQQGAAVVGRLAGDEFTVFLPVLRHADDAERMGQRIIESLAEPFHVAGNELSIGASVGLALYPAHGANLSELMRAADAAMYRAKDLGRGRVERFGSAIERHLAARTELDGELRRALARDEFGLMFQPQRRVSERGTVSVEALLRWNHPDGVRMPATFMERAEESGLILEIGDRVIHGVAATIARWATMGFEARMAINISPRQLAHVDFFHRLGSALRTYGAPARLIELEIGETLAMRCSPAQIAAIEALRQHGATVAIDGFGTGYTNIGRLRMLPIDRIKLDQSLTAGVVGSDVARSIAQALIGLIHGIGREAVGEGIESQAQAEVLRVLGCDVIQGFGVAEPMDEKTLLAWMAVNRAPHPADARLITSA
jgi:diguanylate cyclase (GGDEF)-like protein